VPEQRRAFRSGVTYSDSTRHFSKGDTMPVHIVERLRLLSFLDR
jgi:hypothetical protein